MNVVEILSFMEFSCIWSKISQKKPTDLTVFSGGEKLDTIHANSISLEQILDISTWKYLTRGLEG